MGKGDKYYAVPHGREPGIYTNWEAAKAQTNGYSNNCHKSFSTMNEAAAFYNGGSYAAQHQSSAPSNHSSSTGQSSGGYYSGTGQPSGGYQGGQGYSSGQYSQNR